jgi:hypothetical protein
MRETLEVLIEEGNGLDGSPNIHLKVYTVDDDFELSEISFDHPRNSVVFSHFLLPSSSPSSLWSGSLFGERLPDILQ